MKGRPEMAWTKEQRANHCRQIGTLGGQKTVQTYGPKYMAEIGKIGFDEYAKRHHDGHRAAAWKALQAMKQPRVPQPVGMRYVSEITATKAVVERLAAD